ncbi:hypothetical protein TraAM80_04581 [Trypanosoma rangeli]|uniref:Nuclear RNA export factor 1/2 n=1 Tax=Trypanosoma rangeli TaxID=5698 RepID=A0A3R7L0T2_TRYRA|nr:uncharacterized protein TraAM80_04581 [Trypanosoma rangeli]RNF05290.1 hypothetical protein TraAM80_04581 [Trypanosoma rangeli]|eukprot:RNF05290.1 hypothetical protein TraAM80_04581 [Trypanosoma rangeli]
MLSSTGGYAKRSRVLGRRRDDTTLCSTLCPALRTHGFCRGYVQETSLRARVAAEKEEELLRSATELFRLQEEVLQDGAVTDERQRTAAIDNIVAELKREKSYENWSLDVAVAERMASLRLRRCPYSHRREMQAELRQLTRRESVRPSETTAQGVQVKQPQKKCLSTQRQRVFGSLSPLQKCVVCLLWQGCFEVPLKVVCDLRRRLEAEMQMAEGGDVDDADVETEEQRVVTVTACYPSLGVVDLSSLPHIVAYVSQHPDAAVIRPETAAHFTGGNVLRLPRGVTEKQIDLSSPACAHELVEAIVWSLHVMNDEATQLQQQKPVMLRSLTVRRCAMTSADALVNALRKHQMDSTLLALNMSENRLMSLRFLFVLRAHFSSRLLRLSLADNPITRKPEYREQVRKSLPRLTSLDGRAIRRPPLSMPHPTAVSYTFCTAAQGTESRRVIASEEVDAVVDGLARFLYVWETRRVPWTVAELQYQRQQRRRCHSSAEEGQVDEDAGPELHEEELNDDNFHHRYLHPSATFSMTLHEDLAFFDASTMRLATEVELDDAYAGMRLSPLDVRELGVFDVAMKNNSRNLLIGRSVLHRFARGSLNCYAAYNYSLYPQRLGVCHHFSGAVVSVSKITDTTAPAVSEAGGGGGERRQQPQPRRKKRRWEAVSPPHSSLSPSAATTAAAASIFSVNTPLRKPTFYIVTMHGVMSWRAPSMKRSECVLAAYDRVMTFVENALPPTNPVEKRRSAPLLVFNDQVHLRPVTNGRSAWFVAQTEDHVARLVVEYGLEACADGAALVRAVVERASSDAAASAALRLLVFGWDSSGAEGEVREEGAEALPANHDGVDVHIDDDAPASHHFDICSLISAERPSTGQDEAEAMAEDAPHRVTLAQVEAAVAAMNRRHTAAFIRHAPHGEWGGEANDPLGEAPKAT